MLNRSRRLASVAVMALVAGVSTPAWAETLQEAIALAYRTNPTLLAQRANQRALDESIVTARAGLRPSVDLSVSASYSRTDTAGFVVESDTGGASVGLSQTLYSGGRLAHGITGAEASILSGRENLRAVEQSVLVQVIQAYADVLRDTEILRIRQENVGVLRRQLSEARARFDAGEVTRTDVAQAEARLAQSEADLASAQAQLSVSRATYAAIVGQSPTELQPLPPLPGVPTDFDAALDIALAENPGVLAALYDQRAAEAAVAAARAEYGPSVRLSASYGGTANDLSTFDLSDRTSFQAGATLSVPLFSGGLNASRVSAALERANAAQIGVEGERRQVLQNVSSAYAQVVSARSGMTAGEQAVRAARVAAEGVRLEAQEGLRTTLDVLNAELEVRAAEVALVSARRNEYVAQAQLLAAMGRLDASLLAPGLDLYDPAANYQRVRNRGAVPWEGAVEALDGVLAPRVTPAADAEDAPIDTRLKGEVVVTAPRN